MEGFILPGHPQLDRLVREWVDGYNKEVEEHNKGVRGEWETYCKQWE